MKYHLLRDHFWPISLQYQALFHSPSPYVYIYFSSSLSLPDWRQEEKGVTEDEMVGWHYRLKRLNRHQSEWTLGDGEGQGSLVCCSPWGHSQTRLNNWHYLMLHLFSCWLFVSPIRMQKLPEAREFPVEKAMAPHSSTLAWKIPWMEEPGRLQSMGLLRVGHDWATSLTLFTFMHWRRKWQLTPVFLPGESQGWGSLVGCHLWGRTESDTTEVT